MFTFKLEHEDGTPSDPPVLATVAPTWDMGDTIRSARTRCFASSRRGSRTESRC
jgi:hypothetical protein